MTRAHIPAGELTIDAGERIDHLAAELGGRRRGCSAHLASRPHRARRAGPGAAVADRAVLAALAAAPSPLTPAQCADRARAAAAALDVTVCARPVKAKRGCCGAATVRRRG